MTIAAIIVGWIFCGLLGYPIYRHFWTWDGVLVWTIGERHFALFMALCGPLFPLVGLVALFHDKFKDRPAKW